MTELEFAVNENEAEAEAEAMSKCQSEFIAKMPVLLRAATLELDAALTRNYGLVRRFVFCGWRYFLLLRVSFFLFPLALLHSFFGF